MIKALLLLAGAALVAFFVANRRKARAKAGVKIGFVLFVVFMVYAVIRPDDLTWVARQLGVQRGTDLMLYALVMAFAFVTVSTYVRFREQEMRYARLARAVALRGAIRPEDPMPGSPGVPGIEPVAGGGPEVAADQAADPTADRAPGHPAS